MSQNVFQLNEIKSEIIIFGPPKSSAQISHKHLGSLSADVKPAATNLGVIFDSDLMFEKQITKVVQFMFYQLRSIL